MRPAPLLIEIAEHTINSQTEQILEDIYRRQPDVAGFSCYIWNIRYVLELVRDLHKVLPDTDIWLGGPEVSFDAPQLLRREPEVLGIMKGEGEETFSRLVQCYRQLGQSTARAESGLREAGPGRADGSGADPSAPAEKGPGEGRLSCFWQQLSGLAGLTFRDRSGCIHDLPARPVMDLDQIPFLCQDLETMEDFDHRIVYYESSRGCPFSCSYCLSSIDRTVRFRSLELVEKELQVFLDRRVPQVKFVDRTFNCRKSHALAVWSYILEHDNGITNFHFEVAADLMDEEELKLLARMRPGLVQLEIGVQSTNPRTIREIHRKMDVNQVESVVARIHAGHNIHQHLDLIAGLPYEDYDSFHRSFVRVYRMRPQQLQLGFLKVLKGSCMHQSVQDYGLVFREQPPYEVISTRWLSFEDVLRLKGVENMVEVYYNSGQFTTVVKLLEAEFPDPFIMYAEMAEYYRRNRLCGMNHSRLARFGILHDFIVERLEGTAARRQQNGGESRSGPEEKAERLSCLEDAMMFDLYLRENAKSRPDFALDQTPWKEQIRTLVPGLRSFGSQVHVERFRSGEIWMFDYRKRDPLTRNATVTRVDEPQRS